MIELIDTGLEDLKLFKLQIFHDERGAFFESWRHKEYEKIGIKEKFVQDNVSFSRRGVLRGLHYQKNQGQLVTIGFGKIFDVVVDIRPDSKTYKKYFSIELNAQDPYQLYMPPGFAHGFCVLSNMAVVNYKCTQYYNASHEGGIIWNDPEIGIQWPTKEYNISTKDQSFRSLKETGPTHQNKKGN